MRRLLLVPVVAIILVLATGFGCLRLRQPGGPERRRRARAHEHARRLARRRRALRDQLRVRERPDVLRLDHPAAGRADEGRARWRLDPAAAGTRGRAPPASARRRRRRGGARHERRRRAPADAHRLARRHDRAWRRCRGRRLGARSRASTSRPTRPRCWSSTLAGRRTSWPPSSTPPPPSHRASTRVTASRCISRSPSTALGALAHTRDRQARVRTGAGGRVPPDGRRARAARRTGAASRAVRAGVGIAARRPPRRPRHELGSTRHVVHVPEGRRGRR